jgi:hypothetical protein
VVHQYGVGIRATGVNAQGNRHVSHVVSFCYWRIGG